ncbi:hypothetical protein AAMO2058_000320000 [Amorphochlora amoebiformis]
MVAFLPPWRSRGSNTRFCGCFWRVGILVIAWRCAEELILRGIPRGGGIRKFPGFYLEDQPLRRLEGSHAHIDPNSTYPMVLFDGKCKFLHSRFSSLGNEVNYTCDKCNNSFGYGPSWMFQAYHHSFACPAKFRTETIKVMVDRSDSKYKAYKKVWCETCSNWIEPRFSEVHRVFHVYFPDRDLGTGYHPMACEFCPNSKKMKGSISFVKHMRAHFGYFEHQCPMCQARVIDQQDLLKHIRSHIEEYNCTTCGAKFSAYHTYLAHNRIHAKKRPYACSYCDSTFRQKGHLRYHMGAFHNENGQYKCLECGEKFMTKRAKNLHRYTHSECPTCKACGYNMTYERMQNLSRLYM